MVMSDSKLRWETAVIFPSVDNGWDWALEKIFFIPAIVRLLVSLKKSGINQAHFLGISDRDFLKIREALKCIPEKRLPEVFAPNNGNICISNSSSPVLMVLGGFLWHDSIIKWFNEKLLTQKVGAIYQKNSNIPCLASLNYELFCEACLPKKNMPPVIDFTISFLWPSDIFCAPVSKFFENPKTVLELVGKPSDRPHVVLVRHLIYPFLYFCADKRVHPNHITWLGFLVHITGCYFIARFDYFSGIIGGVFLILSWILDCADGTLARLTFQESDYGRVLDTRLGHLSNITFFAALLVRSWNSYSLFSLIFMGILIFGGITFAASTHAKISNVAKNTDFSNKYADILIKVNHRDYGFVVLAFAVLNILPIFLWLGVIGVYFFGFLELLILLKVTPRGKKILSR